MMPKMLVPDALLPLPPEDHPCLDDLEMEDGKPLDSMFQEKSHRLLTEPLFSSWAGPGDGRPFLVFSNTGLFYAVKKPPLMPDIMLRLDMEQNRDLSLKENQAYLVWIVGKPPNVVIEFVSDTSRGEATHKLTEYADIAVSYYAIFDPYRKLSTDILKIHQLAGGAYQLVEGNQLDEIGLGLMLWRGKYEGQAATWLRWCDTEGVVIPTGKESADEAKKRRAEAKKRADKLAQQRNDRLAAKLRAARIDPHTLDDA